MRTPGDDLMVALRVRRANLPALEAGVRGFFTMVQLEGARRNSAGVPAEYALHVEGDAVAQAATPEPVAFSTAEDDVELVERVLKREILAKPMDELLTPLEIAELIVTELRKAG